MTETSAAWQRLKHHLNVMARLYLIGWLIKLTPSSELNSMVLLLKLNEEAK